MNCCTKGSQDRTEVKSEYEMMKRIISDQMELLIDQRKDYRRQLAIGNPDCDKFSLARKVLTSDNEISVREIIAVSINILSLEGKSQSPQAQGAASNLLYQSALFGCQKQQIELFIAKLGYIFSITNVDVGLKKLVQSKIGEAQVNKYLEDLEKKDEFSSKLE